MTAARGDPTTTRTLNVLYEIFAEFSFQNFSVRLWNGVSWRPRDATESVFTLVLKHPGSLRKMFFNPNMLTLGHAYVTNDFDFEGDLQAAFRLGEYLLMRRWTLRQRVHLAFRILRLPRPADGDAKSEPLPFATLSMEKQDRSRTKQAIGYHYDLPPEFFALWLDQRMIYSCAFFADANDDLETAQRQKLEYLCRKLRLRQADRLLDWGCGWGALALHAASRYGAQVHGVTISEQQARYSSELIQRAGFADRCKIELKDYRDIDAPASYDRLVSVGMAEHVREEALPSYFAHAGSLVRPGGIFVHHAIGSSRVVPLRRGPSFMDRYIFPDTQLVPIDTTLRAAEGAGWEVRDVENLREHYALTLEHWLSRFQRQREAIEQLTDAATYRKFQIYLAGCVHDFHCGRLNLYQTILVRPAGGASGLPMTRNDLMITRA